MNRGTVSRRAGVQARDLNDESVALSPRTREVHLDEKWSFVAKKQPGLRAVAPPGLQ